MSPTSHELVIESAASARQYWRDLWRYRELFYFLAWRDLLVRYKQTVIGVAWALLRPLATLVVFTIVFGKFARLPSDGVPYPVLVLAALLPWQLFASTLGESSQSLVSNANLISRVYFPRLIVPVSAVITSFVDFLVSALCLGLLMVYYGFWPTWRVCTLPLFAALALAASLGAGVWLAALTVKYRDFRFIVPFLVQLGLFVSPVGYSSTVVSERWRWLFSLNPMAGIIDGFRWAVHPADGGLYLPGLGLSTVVVTVLCLTGLWYFRRTEQSFADFI